jgi:mitogen-activated protein kinase kinase kinase
MTVSEFYQHHCSPLIDHINTDLLTGNRINRPSLQGSVFWMAPEVVKQTGHTRKADIWSVGCLVVEMFTGEHPWAQLTQMQAIFKVEELSLC